MIDGVTASRIARMEHEELVRSLAPVYDYDEWLTHEAGEWQAQNRASVFAALGRGLTVLIARLQRKPKPQPEAERLPAVPEAGSVTG